MTSISRWFAPAAVSKAVRRPVSAVVWAGALVVLTAPGCGKQESSVPVAVKSPAEQARAVLEQFAQSGETDSSIVSLREMLDAIAAKDPAKAGLVADCDALMSLRGKEQVKAKAEEMIGKLQ